MSYFAILGLKLSYFGNAKMRSCLISKDEGSQNVLFRPCCLISPFCSILSYLGASFGSEIVLFRKSSSPSIQARSGLSYFAILSHFATLSYLGAWARYELSYFAIFNSPLGLLQARGSRSDYNYNHNKDPL